MLKLKILRSYKMKSFREYIVNEAKKSIVNTDVEDSSAFIPDWKRDYQYEYGINWENTTFQKAAKEVLGRDVFNQWVAMHKKKR